MVSYFEISSFFKPASKCPLSFFLYLEERYLYLSFSWRYQKPWCPSPYSKQFMEIRFWGVRFRSYLWKNEPMICQVCFIMINILSCIFLCIYVHLKIPHHIWKMFWKIHLRYGPRLFLPGLIVFDLFKKHFKQIFFILLLHFSYYCIISRICSKELASVMDCSSCHR